MTDLGLDGRLLLSKKRKSLHRRLVRETSDRPWRRQSSTSKRLHGAAFLKLKLLHNSGSKVS